jgi:hypothetical protein
VALPTASHFDRSAPLLSFAFDAAPERGSDANQFLDDIEPSLIGKAIALELCAASGSARITQHGVQQRSVRFLRISS